jgi:drug/metabolite transporter superfamily protein YnfA
MGSVKNLISKFGIIGELLSFLWQRKLWWLIPMIIILVLFGLLLVLTQGSALAPFIYTLF